MALTLASLVVIIRIMMKDDDQDVWYIFDERKKRWSSILISVGDDDNSDDDDDECENGYKVLFPRLVDFLTETHVSWIIEQEKDDANQFWSWV